MLDQIKVQEFKKLLSSTQSVLILQPDVEHVDPDSIRSALALGMLLEEQGKKVVLFMNGALPAVNKIIPNTDRFTLDFPKEFDLAIAVDMGSPDNQMTEQLKLYQEEFKKRPFVVIDHHKTRYSTTFPSLEVVDSSTIATGELLYELSKQLGWKVSKDAANHMVWSIMSDSFYTAYSKTPQTLIVLGELAKIGKTVIYDYYKIDLEANALPLWMFEIKRDLMNKIEFYDNGRLSFLFIPKEILAKTTDYVLKMYLQTEMRNIKGVELAVTLSEKDGLLVGSGRSLHTNSAGLLAKQFGGGGHNQAAGFTVAGRPADEVRKEIVAVATAILKDPSYTL